MRASGCYNVAFLVILIDNHAIMPTRPLEHEELEDEVLIQEPAKVILFNDDIHTFDEVITQLIKATRCSEAEAEGLAWEVHNNGKAAVFSGRTPQMRRSERHSGGNQTYDSDRDLNR